MTDQTKKLPCIRCKKILYENEFMFVASKGPYCSKCMDVLLVEPQTTHLPWWYKKQDHDDVYYIYDSEGLMVLYFNTEQDAQTVCDAVNGWDKLPKTVDGVGVVPGINMVFAARFNHLTMKDEVYPLNILTELPSEDYQERFVLDEHVGLCYSTPELATEAAKGVDDE